MQKGGNEFRFAAKLMLDFKQTVIFRDPLAAAKRTGLDLSPAHRDSKVCDEGIFRLSRTMRHDIGPSRAPCRVNSSNGLRHRTNLVQLDQHGVGRLFTDATFNERGDW